jgi:SARP family transcriptional regulator, regulator of embCAB operon
MPQQATLTTTEPQELTTRSHLVTREVNHVSVPDQSFACIKVDLLGGLRLRAGRISMSSRDIGGGRLRRVLLALILHRGFPVSKDQLVTLLWEGSPPSRAKATLESYVSVLRKTLQPCHDVQTKLITTAGGCYSIDMSRIDLDLVRYEHLMSAALRPETSAADALPMLQQAMALVEAPLLPEERDSEWLDEVRRVHNQSIRQNLITAATKVAGTPSGCAERWARLAVEGDPLDESAWHALLSTLVAGGQHAEGLRAYDQCRRLFAAELGCAPGPRLQELYVQLLRGANEKDKDLSQLLEAVVRLHAASGPRFAPAARTPGKGSVLGREGQGGHEQPRSLEQARQALTQLLRRVGTGS